MGCDNIPCNIPPEGFYAYKTIMATQNGIIDFIENVDIYRKYIYSEYWLMKPGDNVSNYLKEPVGFIFMMFKNMEEMERVLIKEYRNDFVKMK